MKFLTFLFFFRECQACIRHGDCLWNTVSQNNVHEYSTRFGLLWVKQHTIGYTCFYAWRCGIYNAKVLPLMLVTAFGILRVVRFLQPDKAESPMYVIVYVTLRWIRVLQWKNMHIIRGLDMLRFITMSVSVLKPQSGCSQIIIGISFYFPT